MLKDRKRTQLQFPLEVKSLDETGAFEGYLAVFGNEDLGGDIIQKGAFTKTLREQTSFPLLWMHNMADPIGSFTAVQDEKGLLICGQLVMDEAVTSARKAYALMKAGVVKGLSVGIRTIKHSWQGSARLIQEAALFEGSLTSIPLNPLTQILSVKSDGPLSPFVRFADTLKAFIPTVSAEVDPDLDYWMNMAAIMRNREMRVLLEFRSEIACALGMVCNEVLLHHIPEITAEQKREAFAAALTIHNQYMEAWFEEVLNRFTENEVDTTKAYTDALHHEQPVIDTKSVATPSCAEPRIETQPRLDWDALRFEAQLALAQFEGGSYGEMHEMRR